MTSKSISISVVIVDDHGMFCEGLASMLRQHDDFTVLAAVQDGSLALQCCRITPPDILIADLAMPGMDGLETIRRALEKQLCKSAVLLTMHKHAIIAEDARRAGASGYIVKDEAFHELADALRAVAAGEEFVEPASLPDNSGSTPALSPRERSILLLIAQGQITKEIADSLNLSDKTVETFRGRLMKKTGSRNVADLVRFAHETGLMAT
ncbi:MAG: response regulator transcription factor [Prosthecobacter sp.]